MKKTIIKTMSAMLAVISIFSTFLFTTSVTASAANKTDYIKPGTYILRNGLGLCYNLYGGSITNGNKVTLWSYSKNDSDLWVIPVYRNGGYKLFDYKMRVVVSDVYRGNKSKPAKNMNIGAWKDVKSEDAFQIFLFERQSNGSYIIRLKSDPSLCIGISKNRNGGRLQLVNYSPKNSSTQWYFCNTNNKKVNVSTNSPTTSKNNAKINALNDSRKVMINTLDSMKNSATKLYNVSSSWVRNKQVAKGIGTAGGSALKAIASATTGSPVGVFDSVVTLSTAALEPETSLDIWTITILKGLSNDCIYWCNRATTLLSKKVTQNNFNEVVTALAEAYGYFDAVTHLGRPIVEKAASANAWTDTFKNIGIGLLGACGYKTADIYSKIENICYLKDFLSTFGTTRAYNNGRQKILNIYK